MFKSRSGENYRKSKHMGYYEDFIKGNITEEIEKKYKTWQEKSQGILSELAFERSSKRYLQDLIEEEYTKNHKKDREYFWYEIPELKKDYKKLRRFLRRLSVKTRRKVLLNMAFTGMTWRNIEDCFGISPTTLSAFVKNTAKTGYDSKLMAYIALLCRVPVSWLVDEKPDNEWDIGFIKHIPDRIMSSFRLIEKLQNIDWDLHEVECIVVKDRGVILNLRLEINSGGFLIELLNGTITGKEIMTLRNIFKAFYCKYGYIETVVSGRVNIALYCGPVTLPMEFRKC